MGSIMNFYKELWRNKLVLSLIILVIILLIVSIIFPISLFQNLTTQLSIITALIIPFIMKGIEKKGKEKDEKDIVIQIIKRIKDYLENIITIKSKDMKMRFSRSMPLFRFISQKFPEILIKIGIEINFGKFEIGNQTSFNISELYILDKYCLELTPFFRFKLIEDHYEIQPDKEKYENILGELIDHVNELFSFKVSKDLAKF